MVLTKKTYCANCNKMMKVNIYIGKKKYYAWSGICSSLKMYKVVNANYVLIQYCSASCNYLFKIPRRKFVVY